MAGTESPAKFDEILRVHDIFEMFEMESAQIGSGRPPGQRFHIWGSIVVLARTALEESMRRVHEQICPGCDHTKPALDPNKFQEFLKNHDRKLPKTLPHDLHVALYRKDDSKSGDGSGTRIDGPLTSEEILKYLGVLNHTRNGFAHADPKKLTKHPDHGSGVLWVTTAGTNEWTIQKPHAFSTIRLCHLVFRMMVFAIWDEKVAVDTRSRLPRLLRERLSFEAEVSPEELSRGLTDSISNRDFGLALKQTADLKRSILASAWNGSMETRPECLFTLSGSSRDEREVLADPVMASPAQPELAVPSPTFVQTSFPVGSGEQ